MSTPRSNSPDSSSSDLVINGRKISQIHAFVLSKLPNGEAREKYLREMIDYETNTGKPGKNAGGGSKQKKAPGQNGQLKSKKKGEKCLDPNCKCDDSSDGKCKCSGHEHVSNVCCESDCKCTDGSDGNCKCRGHEHVSHKCNEKNCPCNDSCGGECKCGGHKHSSDEYTLYAFHARYRMRAEPIRMLFHYSGKVFKDVNVEMRDLPEIREKIPMRQLPALKVRADGKTLVLGQTTAILRYLGKKFGLVPDDDDQQALCDMYAEQVHDLTNPIAEHQWSQFTNSATELETEMFPGKAAGISNRLGKLFNPPLEQGRGYLVGGKLTYADLALAELVDKLTTIAKRKDLFDGYPAVQRHHKQIYGLGQLREYASSRPKYSF